MHRAETTSARKRLAFVCFSHSLGGLELTTLRLAKAMSARKNPSLVVAPPSSPLLARAAEAGLTVESIQPRLTYGDVLTALRLSKIMREHRIEVALLTQSKDLHLAALASLAVPGLRLVFYQQMDSGYDKRDPLHSWVFSRLSRWMTLTEGMKRNVLSFTRMPERSVEVVPLGIDLEQFDSRHYARLTARKLFKLPPKAKIVGVMGRLDPQKGQEVLLRAVPGLIKKHPAIHVVLAGDETAGEPGYRSYLENLCDTLSIESRVTFLPFTNDVPQFMAALDVFVLPSYAETYGLVVIEAMAMRCAVIATDAGGVPEIVENGKTGILVSPRDSEGLATAIHLLLSNRSLRAKIVRSANSSASQHFNFDLTVDRIVRSIASL